MKRTFYFLLLLVASMGLQAQSATPFVLSIDEVSIPGIPGKQSFAWGQHNGQWLILGGRTDGLHQRQPFASFLASGNNVELLVVDPDLGQYWTSGIGSLPQALQEQLQSTNLNFNQRGNILYLTGGYGYSATAADHVTYGSLIAVDLPAAIQAVQQGASLAPHFRAVAHPGMAVTGGQLSRLGDRFYLVGGQYFEGRYNPMGPNHGPGFIQQYTNAIRSFEVSDNGTALSIQNYSEVTDTAELHRRDYNMLPQIFPDGRRGFTVFSGVFQYLDDLPWLNVVDVDSLGYAPVPGFEQLFSHYHGAHLPVYEAGANRMHSYFFGGMAQYYLNAQGGLVNDVNVPFVKMISRVTRFANDSLAEYDTGLEMPGLLGAGAEFIPNEAMAWYDNGVLNVDALPAGKHLVGHIYGGIESSAPNIFFSQNGTQSWSSSRVFEVYVDLPGTDVEGGGLPVVAGFKVWPNPAEEMLRFYFHAGAAGQFQLTLHDQQGREMSAWEVEAGAGPVVDTITLPGLAAGVYLLELRGEGVREVLRVELE